MKRLQSNVMVLTMVVGLLTSASFAQQIFCEDFTDGSLGSGVTGGTDWDKNATAGFISATEHCVNNIYGFTGDQGSATDNSIGGFTWTNPGTTTVDLVNKVMFARISMVSDAYDDDGYVAGNRYTFYCDLDGKNSDTSAVTYYPATQFAEGTGQFQTRSYLDGSNYTATGVMIAEDADYDTVIQPALDGVLTNTFVWRGASTDGTSLTVEMSGAAGAAKATHTSSNNVVLTEVTRVMPSINRFRPSKDGVYQDMVYSSVCGQTNYAAYPPNDDSEVKMGYVKWELGQTVATDFNFDYSTTLADGQIWAAGRSAGIATGGTMSQGDANNDGSVTLADGQSWAAARAGGSSGLGNLETGDHEPLIEYNATTGEVKILADEGSINSIIVRLISTDDYDAADISMAAGNLPTAYGGALTWDVMKEIEGANTPTLAYSDPTFVGSNLANLTNGFGEALIAILPTGLDASDFGQTSVSFSDYGSVVYTGVTITPEPATMSLLAVGTLTLLRRKKA